MQWSKVNLQSLTTKCRECNQNTKLYVRVELPEKKNRNKYIYNLKTRCDDCKVDYLVHDSIFWLDVEAKDEPLFDIEFPNF